MTASTTDTADDPDPRGSEARVCAMICGRYDNDSHRMLDILRDTQDHFRQISAAAMQTIAERTGLSRIEVEGVASFYSFLSLEPKGRVTIRLCDDIVDRFAGMPEVAEAFEEVLGIKMGETSEDESFLQRQDQTLRLINTQLFERHSVISRLRSFKSTGLLRK